MKLVTKQFGDISYTEDAILEFEKGLIGFEKYTQYLILEEEEYKPFRWLVSLENSDIRFPILNPFLFAPEFGNELPGNLVKRIFSSSENVDVFSIVTLQGDNGKVTINLKSPVVINYDKNTGQQIVLLSEDISVAQEIT